MPENKNNLPPLVVIVVKQISILKTRYQYSLKIELDKRFNHKRDVVLNSFTLDKDSICADAIKMIKLLNADEMIYVETEGFNDLELERSIIKDVKCCYKKNLLYQTF